MPCGKTTGGGTALARFLVSPQTTQAFICLGLVILGNRAFSGKGLMDLGSPVAILSAAGLSHLDRTTASYQASTLVRPAQAGQSRLPLREINYALPAISVSPFGAQTSPHLLNLSATRVGFLEARIQKRCAILAP
jgi:hypothetical protein